MQRGWCAALTLVLALLVPRLALAGQDRESDGEHASFLELDSFRLGTAGQPFGWSTVVSDFNADGQPDVAIADRRFQSSGYRLELDVSGRSSYDVVFESPSPVLSVSAIDVDADRDVDLLLQAPLSGETLGVLLNNGSGSFSVGAGAPPPRRSARPVQRSRVAPRTLGGVCTHFRSAQALRKSTEVAPAAPRPPVPSALDDVLRRIPEPDASCGPRAPPTSQS